MVAHRVGSLRWVVALLLTLAVAAVLWAPMTAAALGTTIVSGRVLSPSSTPVEGAAVHFYDMEGNWLTGDFTDDTGAYEVDLGLVDSPVVEVEYQIESSTGDYITTRFTGAFPANVTTVDHDLTFSAVAGKARGRVLDDTSGQPIEGIWVAVSDSGSELAWAQTDEDGVYQIGGIQVGNYKLHFDDWSVHPMYAGEYFDDKATAEEADDVAFAAGTPTPVPDVRLARLGHFTGSVTVPGGEPVYGYVQALTRKTDDSGAYWDWAGSVATEPDGSYDLAIKAGRYRLYAGDNEGRYVTEYWENATDVESAHTLEIAAGQRVEDIDFALAGTVHVTGTITDRVTGLPIEGAWVDAVDENDRGVAVYYATTGADGTYVLHVTEADPCYIRVEGVQHSRVYYHDSPYRRTATPVSASVNTTVSGVDQALDPKGSIAGRVTNTSGIGVAGITVSPSCADEDEGVWLEPTETNANGYYSLPGMSVGSYKLRFTDQSHRYVEEWFDNKADFESATPINITAGSLNPTGRNASLDAAGKVIGYVKSKTTGKGVAGIKVQGYQVDPEYGWNDLIGTAQTDSTGKYTLSGFGSGYATIRAEGGSSFADQYYAGKGFEWDAILVPTVKATTLYGSNLTLAKGASISGTLRRHDGTAASTGYVTALIKSGDMWYIQEETEVSSSGAWALRSLPAGSYKLTFHDMGSVSEYYPNSYDFETAATVTLAEGQARTGYNVQLAHGGYISGTVTLSGIDDAAPTVDAVSADGSIQAGAQADGDGAYELGPLPAGEYTVCFRESPPSGGSPRVQTEWFDDATTQAAATPVAVSENATTTGIDATIAPGGADVGGEVVNSSGEGVEAWVVLDRIDHGDWRDYWYSYSANTDSDGEYRFSNVTPGTYVMRVYPAGSTYAPMYYPQTADSELADPIVISGDREIDATVTAGATLSGSIKGLGGKGIGPNRAEIKLWYDAGADGWKSIEAMQASAVTGEFSFTQLLPGRYKVQFVDSWSAYSSMYHASGTPVTLAAGGSSSVSLSPTHLGTSKMRVGLSSSASATNYGGYAYLRGQVADTNGWGVPSQSVRFYSASKSSGPWTYRGTLKTYTNGLTSTYKVKPSSLTYYKVVYKGTDGVSKSSALVSVKPKAYLSLSAPKSASRTKSFTVSGSLKPRHTKGTSAVKVRVYRKSGSTYKYYKTYSFKVYNYSSYSKFKGSMRLASKGTYRLQAIHSDTAHTTSYSSYRTVVVK